jgi:cysteine desulfurase
MQEVPLKLNFDTESGVPYVDNAVTTPLREQVLEAMLPFLQEKFADPDEMYEPGQIAAEALSGFRKDLAEMVGALPENLWFTSGGTEANNWILRCISRKGSGVSTVVEHLSVLENTEKHIDVDENGLVDLKALKKSLESGKVSILSVQHANQETGVIQDIPAISKLCRDNGVPLHADASMSFGIVPIDMFELGANFLTLSAHKIWGPVGVGALVSDGKYDVEPLLRGGKQEGAMRAGPVNMALIAGFAEAAEILRTSADEWVRVGQLRDKVEMKLGDVTNVVVIGEKVGRLPNMSCLMFPGSDATFLAAEMERLYGMCVGVGGAAEEGSASRVLKAIGMDRPGREATIRLRFSPWLTKKEADMIVVGSCAALRAEQGKPIF